MFFNQELGVSYCQMYQKYMVLICLDLWTIHSEYQHILQPLFLYWVINSMSHLFLTSRWTFLLLFYFELLQNLFRLKHPDISNMSIHRHIHLHGSLTFKITSQVMHWSMTMFTTFMKSPFQTKQNWCKHPLKYTSYTY